MRQFGLLVRNSAFWNLIYQQHIPCDTSSEYWNKWLDGRRGLAPAGNKEPRGHSITAPLWWGGE